VFAVVFLVPLALWIVVRETASHRPRPSASQSIFIVEFALLVIPYLVLVAVISIGRLVIGLGTSVWECLQSLGAIAATLGPLICGMRLSIAFVNGGTPALRAVHPAWWWGAFTGVLVIGGCFIAGKVGPLHPSYRFVFDPDGFAYAAAPLLIPFLHLVLARGFAPHAVSASTGHSPPHSP
jgi:hypothetical protein